MAEYLHIWYGMAIKGIPKEEMQDFDDLVSFDREGLEMEAVCYWMNTVFPRNWGNPEMFRA